MKIVREVSFDDYAAMTEEQRDQIALEAYAYSLLAGERGKVWLTSSVDGDEFLERLGLKEKSELPLGEKEKADA
ncbi:MAG: hypothetical protein OXR62_13595 [Ahrensia sp.]|nr:hypothetical protein [Ahrensia sp.]